MTTPSYKLCLVAWALQQMVQVAESSSDSNTNTATSDTTNRNLKLWKRNGGLKVTLVGISLVFAVLLILSLIWYCFFKSPFYVLTCKKQDARTSFTPNSWTFDDVPESSWAVHSSISSRGRRKVTCMEHKKNFCEKCQEDYTILNMLCKDRVYKEATDKEYRLQLVQSLMVDCYTEDDGEGTSLNKKRVTPVRENNRYDQSLQHTVWRLLKETEDPVMVVSGFAGFCYRLLKIPSKTLDEPVIQLADKATQELLQIRKSPEAVEQNRRMYGWSNDGGDEDAYRFESKLAVDFPHPENTIEHEA